jgi:hypothetical protein
MILLTFDGAINLNNIKYYNAHEYSNYHMVQQMAHEKHEIATETIS